MPVVPVAVAGIGGAIIGHIVWLIGISIARATPSPTPYVLLVSALFLIGAALVIQQARQRYQRKELVWAAFLAGLSVSPVLFTIVVLGVTYL